ncbi:DUF2610 domain-containing protein [Streptacidiphilus sp. N1-12]|uniref:DUF2610 domain-containing protein n=2 Tax=Streptacidiphilus alkalitolerans TaxID=3342712 RepID=A0ABV6XB71_9ACTN
MKKFTIPCDFSGEKAPFNIYIGAPAAGHHPLQHQSAWLSRERGGSVPSEVMDSFQKLFDISLENGVDFEQLCVYALGTASGDSSSTPADAGPDGPGSDAPAGSA